MPLRERKRPDYTQKVYKFRAYPQHEIPQAFWDHARAMQQLWNGLIGLRDQVIERTQSEEKTAAKPLWKQFNADLLNCAKRSPLDWESKGEILDRFRVASRKAFREGATLIPQHALKKIAIPHRFTGGGLPIARFLNQTERAFHIRLMPDSRRGRQLLGHFGVNGTNIPFALSDWGYIASNKFPTEGFVKKVMWCGNHNRFRPKGREWEWSLHVTVEEPPRTIARTDTRIAGLDLGWRIMAEGTYLRIGMLTDSDGRTIELRLPLMERSHEARKNPDWAYSLYDLWHLDEQIGEAVENCKSKLRGMLVPLPAGFVQMREKGLATVLKEHTDGEVGNVIREMFARNRQLRQRRRAVHDRLLRHRDYLYRNLSAWLTKTYRIIVWEGDLSLREMAENTENVSLKNAAKYRQFASLYSLRQYLKQATVKNGNMLQGEPAADSTRICWECGELTDQNGKLFLECPNGHRWDQDENASKNLLVSGLSQTSQGFEQSGSLRKYLLQQKPDAIEIPELLRAVAVACSQG